MGGIRRDRIGQSIKRGENTLDGKFRDHADVSMFQDTSQKYLGT